MSEELQQKIEQRIQEYKEPKEQQEREKIRSFEKVKYQYYDEVFRSNAAAKEQYENIKEIYKKTGLPIFATPPIPEVQEEIITVEQRQARRRKIIVASVVCAVYFALIGAVFIVYQEDIAADIFIKILAQAVGLVFAALGAAWLGGYIHGLFPKPKQAEQEQVVEEMVAEVREGVRLKEFENLRILKDKPANYLEPLPHEKYIIDTILGRYESLKQRIKYYDFTQDENKDFDSFNICDIPLEPYQRWAVLDCFNKNNTAWETVQFISDELAKNPDKELSTKQEKRDKVAKAAFQRHSKTVLAKQDTSRFFLQAFKSVVPFHARKTHTHILGKTGSGKSEFMKLMIWHDTQQSSSVFLLDPHDKLSYEVSRFRYFQKNPDQLLYLSARMYKKPLWASFQYNPLQHKYYKYPHGIRISKIQGKIERLSEAFSAIMKGDFTEPQKDIIENCLALLMLQEGRHLGDFMRLIHPTKEPPQELLTPLFNLPNIDEYSNLKDYFRDIFFEDYTKQSKNKLFSRFNRILGTGALRRILYNPKSSFDLENALESGKTVCVGLDKDSVGIRGLPILGAFFVSEINHFANGRPREEEEIAKRKQVFCYVDEFQNFIHEDFKEMLVETRKYKVAFTMAHHYLSQLSNVSQKAILGNTSVRFVGKGEDIEKLGAKMGFPKDVLERNKPTLERGRFLYQAANLPPQVIQGHTHLLGTDDPQFYTSKEEYKEVLKWQLRNYYIITPEATETEEETPQAPQEPTTPTNTETPPNEGYIPTFDDLDI